MSKNLLNSLIDEMVSLLQPLAAAADDPYVMDSLLQALDAGDPRLTEGLVDGLRSLGRGIERLKGVRASSDASLQSVGDALEALRDLTAAARTLGHSGASPYPALGADLINLLVITRLRLASPLAYQLATMLGLAEYQVLPAIRINGELVRYPQPVERLVFDRIGTLFTDPLALIREHLPSPPLATVANAEQTADIVVNRIGGVLNALGVPWMYGYPAGDERFLGESVDQAAHTLVLYLPFALTGEDFPSGFCINLSSAEADDLGVVLTPFGTLNLKGTLGRWNIGFQLTADVEAFAFGGGRGVKLLASPSTTELSGNISATLAAPIDGPAFIFGSSTGTRLEVGGAKLSAETILSEKRQAIALSAAVSSSAIVIAPGDGDSFLRSFLPAEGLQAKFDLGLAWSNERGFSLSGNAGLDADLPVGLAIRGVTVPTVHLGLHASDAGIKAEVSASVGVSIGPVRALVNRVGLTAVATFPENGGNLGVADLEFGFKPPSGVGLVIDAAGVSGGGFLLFDQAKGQYAGVVLLNLEGGITVKAMGLICTRLPNRAKGFSFVAMIVATDFKPIPLGLGFTLTGIGGLLAINRTFNEVAVSEGIKSQALEQVLSPKDPVKNAAQISSSLNTFFPAKNGSYLLGVLAKIHWGTEALLKMELALIFETGKRLRLIALGRLSVCVPNERNDLVRLNMNAIGVIDFDLGTASLDAALYDSRLFKKFVLTGQMAMRLRWASSPHFALSVGGFHPAFKPPPGFPALQRIAISLSESEAFSLRCEGYLALTSNTLQFGARAQLTAHGGSFSIHGEIGFNALIQFDPFMFVADFHASVHLKHGSTDLFSVTVSGELTGPRPLHTKGKASFSIFWCSFSVRFSKTLISGEPPPASERINVMARLLPALADARNWGGQLPESDRRVVTLRERHLAGEIALHPLGRLTVKQSVVPLNLEIAKFGPTTPADARLFKLNNVTVNDDQVPFDTEQDFFAPAEFLAMTDDEKLTAPSFEPLTAGFSLKSLRFILPTNDDDMIEETDVSYETFIIDQKVNPARKSSEPGKLNATHLDKQLRFGAAARSDVQRTGAAKFRTRGVKNVLKKTGWIVVAEADQTPQSAPGIEAGKLVGYAEAFQALQELRLRNPSLARSLKIVRASEPVS